MSNFNSFHPFVNLIFFVFIITFSMFVMHPVFIFISFISSIIYSVLLKGIKSLKFNLYLILALLFYGLVINPLFNHKGITILFYFKNGCPFTLESVLYGLASAGMLISVILWFSCLNEIITDDKIKYLFGRILPSLSLIVSMILRFVPKFKNQYMIVLNSQIALGTDVNSEKLINKIKLIIKVLSIMICWSMENAIDTADSMKSRGYGLKKRTSFHLYKFELRDMVLISIIISTATLIIFFMQTNYVYFPMLTNITISARSVASYILFGILCFLPILLDSVEVLKWR